MYMCCLNKFVLVFRLDDKVQLYLVMLQDIVMFDKYIYILIVQCLDQVEKQCEQICVILLDYLEIIIEDVYVVQCEWV